MGLITQFQISNKSFGLQHRRMPNSPAHPASLPHTLNLSAGYISQLERGTKQPKGPALALLNVIRRKGLEAIL